MRSARPQRPRSRGILRPDLRVRRARAVRARGRPLLVAVGLLAATATATVAPRTSAQEGVGARVSASRLVIEGGGRVDWSRQGDRLAFDRPGDDGLFDLWIHDLETGGERCLTCGAYEFRKAHALSPEWGPAGEWLVLQRQENANKLDLGVADLLGPQRGLWSDVWLIRADGKSYWQLTRLTEQGSTVLDPQVSFEGERLLWAERTASREGSWGAWQLRTARLETRRGVPRLGKLERHRSPDLPGLVVPHGFLPDDRRLLFSAERSARAPGLDLAIFDPASGEVAWLTRAGAGAHAAVAPRSPLIAFPSPEPGARGPAMPGGGTGELAAAEVWLMALDGTSQRPLTRFNQPDSVESLGRTWVGDLAWSPAGDRLAVQVVHGAAEGRPAIVVLELERERDPQ